jgi:hypothetical protein
MGISYQPSTTLSIFPRVEDPQDEHIAVGQLVPHLVVSDQDPSDLAWFELGQADSEPRVGGNSLRTGH